MFPHARPCPERRIILVVAVVDWWTKPYVSLGFIFIFVPIMLAAAFLPRQCSYVRLGFETPALAGCGLFVAELVRNRRLTLRAQERLKALVETSLRRDRDGR